MSLLAHLLTCSLTSILALFLALPPLVFSGHVYIYICWYGDVFPTLSEPSKVRPRSYFHLFFFSVLRHRPQKPSARMWATPGRASEIAYRSWTRVAATGTLKFRALCTSATRARYVTAVFSDLFSFCETEGTCLSKTVSCRGHDECNDWTISVIGGRILWLVNAQWDREGDRSPSPWTNHIECDFLFFANFTFDILYRDGLKEARLPYLLFSFANLRGSGQADLFQLKSNLSDMKTMGWWWVG